MKKYLKDLEVELRKNNLSEEEINEILADHAEMIEAAKNDGLSDEELTDKFGNPKKVAEELSDFSEQAKPTDETLDKSKADFQFDHISEGYNVKISLISEDIIIKTSKESYISVQTIGKFDPEKYNVSYDNNTFVIEALKRKSRFSIGFKKSIKFIVQLPQDIKLNEFNFKTINSDGEINGIQAKAIKLATNNGDLEISDLVSQELKLNTINGDIEMVGATCHNFDISTICGDLETEKIKVEQDIRVNTVSGDLEMKDIECKSLSLKTVSGDIIAEEMYPKELSLSSVSGDIKIVNSQKDRPIILKNKKSVSGDIDIYIK